MSKQDVILFGASSLGRSAYIVLKDKYNILYYCDNDSSKAGTFINGIEIISVEELEKINKEIKIIITSTYSKEIEEQLIDMGRRNILKFSFDVSGIENKGLINTEIKDVVRSFFKDNGDKKDFPYFTLGKHSYINGMRVQRTESDEVINIHIGNYCSISYDVLLLVNRNHDYKSISTSPFFGFFEVKRRLKQKGQIIIGNDVWIGNDVTIFSGVRIGNGAVIGAGTMVTKDIPPYAIAVGNPMKIVKYRFNEEEISKLQAIKWWNWSNEKISKNKKLFNEDLSLFIDEFYVPKKQADSTKSSRDSKSILFIPDFDNKYSVWQKVIQTYVEVFSDNNRFNLRIGVIKKYHEYKNEINIIKDIIHKEGIDNIDIVFSEKEELLFKDVDYFITTRDESTMKYIDLADDNNVEILSGVDCPLFEKVLED